MTLYQTLRDISTKALVTRDSTTRGYISVYLGAVDLVAKKLQIPPASINDAEVVKILQGAYTACLDNISKLNPEDPRYANNVSEVKFLASVIPSDKLPMSDAEVMDKVKTYLLTLAPTSKVGLGSVMGWLGKTYPGQYEGKSVSVLVKALLD